jgi:hypothetical protein
MSLFGYINRLPETTIVRKTYKWKPFTSRPVEKPKSRWEDNVRNDMKKIKIITRTEKIQNRHKLNGIVEKSKTVSEL